MAEFGQSTFNGNDNVLIILVIFKHRTWVDGKLVKIYNRIYKIIKSTI